MIKLVDILDRLLFVYEPPRSEKIVGDCDNCTRGNDWSGIWCTMCRREMHRRMRLRKIGERSVYIVVGFCVGFATQYF